MLIETSHFIIEAKPRVKLSVSRPVSARGAGRVISSDIRHKCSGVPKRSVAIIVRWHLAEAW